MNFNKTIDVKDANKLNYEKTCDGYIKQTKNAQLIKANKNLKRQSLTI